MPKEALINSCAAILLRLWTRFFTAKPRHKPIMAAFCGFKPRSKYVQSCLPLINQRFPKKAPPAKNFLNILCIDKTLPAALLYLVLFFPNPNEFSGLLEAEKNKGSISLSVDTAVLLTLFFYTPAIILFLFSTNAAQKPAARFGSIPRKAACAARTGLFFILDTFFTLTGLIAIGLSVSNLSAAFNFPLPTQQIILADYTISTILAVSLMLCAGAVLEEVFFRRYLISVCEETGVGIVTASIVSLLLFTLPHAWEGIFGMINAVLAGLYLTTVYLQKRSLSAPALAHCLYNTAAFLGSI